MSAINELQLAKELIRFPSVTKTDAGVIKYLEKKLKKIGKHYQRLLKIMFS